MPRATGTASVKLQLAVTLSTIEKVLALNSRCCKPAHDVGQTPMSEMGSKAMNSKAKRS